MIEKIYGVTGLMEWDALISCGKARLRVKFEGGSSSGFGEAPALYRTTNPAAQHIIEESGYFKEGRIRLLRINRFAEPGEEATAKPTADRGTQNPPEASVTPAQPGAPLLLEEKTFPDAGLARKFLRETFGIPANKMGTTKAVREMGELYGYRLIFRP